MKNQVEIIRAAAYYGSHATGTVVLVNGQPRHFTGKHALTEARDWVDAFEAEQKNESEEC